MVFSEVAVYKLLWALPFVLPFEFFFILFGVKDSNFVQSVEKRLHFYVAQWPEQIDHTFWLLCTTPFYQVQMLCSLIHIFCWVQFDAYPLMGLICRVDMFQRRLHG